MGANHTRAYISLASEKSYAGRYCFMHADFKASSVMVNSTDLTANTAQRPQQCTIR